MPAWLRRLEGPFFLILFLVSERCGLEIRAMV